MIGTTVGNYRVLDRIGDGGMGTVYRGVDDMLDREVALKVMRPELSRQAQLSERFRQEAVALARLAHVNITTVFGLERTGDQLVMVMEFVRGETLEAIVQRSGKIAWQRAFELAAAVADALDHAHDKGVVHRDIKPANVMLTRQGVVKVMDFGIARILGRSRQTRVGAAVGTPMYMSPEQLRGEEVDGRSDQYSLGAVIYELITGRMAFEADSDYELMMKQLNEPPPPVRACVPDVPPQVDEILQRTMAKRADERYPSVRHLAAALRAAIGTQPAATTRATPATRLADVLPPPPVAERQVPLGGLAITADHATPADPRVAATRLADTPIATPATRLEDSPVGTPATRLASPMATPSESWYLDWRIWSIAATVLLAAAITLRSLRGPDTEADAGKGAAVLAERGKDAQLPADTIALQRRVDLEPSPPPRTQEEPVVAPTQPAPARTAPPTPDPVVREPTRPPTRAVARPQPEAVKKQADAVAPPEAAPAAPSPRAVEPRAEPRSEREDPPAEDAGAARGAIAAAIERFAEAVSGGNTGYVGGVLQGGSESQVIELMKEGRLSMSVTGTPDVDVSGGRATARFSATLNARSAFGANRKRNASFVAELERGGSSWRLRSVRAVGKLDLK